MCSVHSWNDKLLFRPSKFMPSVLSRTISRRLGTGALANVTNKCTAKKPSAYKRMRNTFQRSRKAESKECASPRSPDGLLTDISTTVSPSNDRIIMCADKAKRSHVCRTPLRFEPSASPDREKEKPVVDVFRVKELKSNRKLRPLTFDTIEMAILRPVADSK